MGEALTKVPIDRDVLRPTVFVVISKIVSMISFLILTRVVLAAIGKEQYGLFVLVQSALAILAMADFGMGAAIKNHIASEKTNGNWDKINAAVPSFALLYLGIGFLVFMACLLSVQFLSSFWPSILNVQGALVPVASRLVIIVGLIIAIKVIASLWLNVFQGLQMVSWIYKLNILLSFIQLIAVWSAMKILPRIEVYCFLQGIFSSIGVAILIPIAFRKFPSFRPKLSTRPWRVIKPLLTSSSLFFILTINSFIFTSTDNLILTHFVGLESVTSYSLSYKLFVLSSGFLGSYGIVLWPLLSCLFAENRKSDLQTHYTSILRYTIITFLGSMLFILMVSDMILEAWLGHDYFQGFPLMIVFASTLIIFSWGGVHVLFCNSMGKLKFQVLASFFGVIVNLVLSIILVKKVGMIGVAIGTLCGTIVGTALPLPWYVSKLINVNPIKELEKILRSYIGPVIFLGLALFLTRSLALNDYLKLSVSGIIGCLFAFFVARFVLLKEEKSSLCRHLGRIGYIICGSFE